MPEKPPEVFNSERLLLRKPVMEDAPAIFESYAQDVAVTQYLTWQPHRSIKETQSFLKRCHQSWQRSEAFPWTIIRKSDNQLLGMVEITGIDHAGICLGYVLAKSYWGKGYMAESLGIIIEWAFMQNDIYRVWAYCDVENTASRNVMEKCGLQCEGVLRNWLKLPQFGEKPRDCFCYSTIK
jgi:RimJ/RimL family protein N-acetyltransferase